MEAGRDGQRMNLMAFGEKYPFLKANLAFWESYMRARNEVSNELSRIIKLSPYGGNGQFSIEYGAATPLLASLKLSLGDEDIAALTETFCRVMGLELCSVQMGNPVPVFDELNITTDTKGFVLAEIHAAIASFVENQVADNSDVIHWLEPFCPICGAHAALGLITPSGKKNLVCSHCHSAWDYMRTACGLCGHTEERGGMFVSADELPDWAVENCTSCGHYLKINDMRSRLPDIIAYPLHYLTTWELDLAVRDKGYRPAFFKVFERAGWVRFLQSN